MKKLFLTIVAVLLAITAFSQISNNNTLKLSVKADPAVNVVYTPPPSDFLDPNKTQTAAISVNYVGPWTVDATVAFNKAVRIWEKSITSSLLIRIDANYKTLPAVTLGQAWATSSQANFCENSTCVPMSPKYQSNTWYAIALAKKMKGNDLLVTTYDIGIEMNSSVTNWYFGTDGATPSTKYDFVSVALHEIAHGLGFFSTARDSAGTRIWTIQGLPNIYDRYVVNSSGTRLTSFPYSSTTLEGFLTSKDLYWDGVDATTANGSNPKLYAPSPWEIGSSISHFDEATFNGTPNSSMTPSFALGEARHNLGGVGIGLMKDIGWIEAIVVGIEDRIEFTGGPSIFSPVIGDPASGCPYTFCPIIYSAQFFDEDPYGDYIVSWDWNIKLFHSLGTYNLTGSNMGSQYWITSAFTLPDFDWNRDGNGNILGNVHVEGIDNDGVKHEDNMFIGVLAPPNKPLIEIERISCNSVKLTYLSSGATSYKVFYGITPGVYTGTGLPQGNSPINTGSANTITLTGLSCGQCRYFAVKGYNSHGESVFSNEVDDRDIATVNNYIARTSGTWEPGSNPFNNTTGAVVIGENLTIDDNTNITIKNMTFKFRPTAGLNVRTGANLTLNNTTFQGGTCNDRWEGLEADNATITLEGNSLIRLPSLATALMENSSTLTINAGSTLEVSNNAQVNVKTGSKLIIGDNALLDAAFNSLVHIQAGGELILKNTTAGKGLCIGCNSWFFNDTGELRVEGTLTTTAGVDLKNIGDGFFSFYGSGALNLGSGSNVVLSGKSKTDHLLKIYNSLIIPAGHNLDLRNGKVVVTGANTKLAATGSQVFIDNVAFDGLTKTTNTGLLATAVTGLRINNCTIQNLNRGIGLLNIVPVSQHILQSTFTGCDTAITATSINNVLIFTCNFAQSNIGVNIVNSTNTTIAGSNFVTTGIAIRGKNTSQINLNNCDITNNYGFLGVKLDGVGDFYMSGGRIHNCNPGIYGVNSNIYVRNGAKIDENYPAGIELYGTTANLAKLTVGDQGCGWIYNNNDLIQFLPGKAVIGQNILLDIDQVTHASATGKPMTPNRFDGNAAPIFDICYSDYPPSTTINARGNFWGTNASGTGGIDIGSSKIAYIIDQCGVPKSDIPLITDNFSTCIPQTNCEDCGGKGGISVITKGVVCPAIAGAVEKKGMLTGGNTWANGVFTVSGTVTVASGSVLNIANSRVVFAEEAALLVEEGAKLDIRNSVCEPCANATWRGIEAQGSKATMQTPNNQAFVQIFNSTIRNAEIGVFAGESDPVTGAIIANGKGGIVKIENSTFEDNGIHLYLTDPGAANLISSVKNNVFTQPFAERLFNGTLKHIYVEGTQKVTFEGNSFSDGKLGIVAYGNNELTLKGNSFSNMRNAFDLYGGNPPLLLQGGGRGVVLESNTFTDVLRPVFMENSQTITITSNTFTNFERATHLLRCKDIRIAGNTFTNGTYGILLEECENFAITDNTFTSTERPVETTGSTPGGKESEISRNRFEKPDVAIHFKDDDHSKLRMECNTFDRFTDYAIKSENTMLKDQGTLQESVGNKFISASAFAYQWLDHTGSAVKYHYSPSEAASFANPMVMSPTVVKVQSNKENGCAELPAAGHAKKGNGNKGISQTATTPSFFKEGAGGGETSDFFAGKDALLGNIPNPFKNTTTFIYSLYDPESKGEIRITDLPGRVQGSYTISGMKGSVTVDLSHLAPGIYYYSLYVGGAHDETRKMVVLR